MTCDCMITRIKLWHKAFVELNSASGTSKVKCWSTAETTTGLDRNILLHQILHTNLPLHFLRQYSASWEKTSSVSSSSGTAVVALDRDHLANRLLTEPSVGASFEFGT